MSLIEELKRRHVFRVAIAYAAVSWVVLQFASIVAPTLNLPGWTINALTVIGVAGFPLALFLAWTFQLTPGGIRRADKAAHEESEHGITRGKLNRIIIGLLTLALVLVLAERLILMRAATQETPAGSSASQADP